MTEGRRVWYLMVMCIALAAVAMTSLVLTYRASENSRLAQNRANAAEFRSAKNTILNCVQVLQVQALAAANSLVLPNEPMCDPYEVEQLRQYVKLFEWIESRKPEILKESK